MNKLFLIADEIKKFISESFSIEQEVNPAPEQSPSQLKKEKIFVVPAAWRIENLSRNQSENTATINILYCIRSDEDKVSENFDRIEKIQNSLIRKNFKNIQAVVRDVDIDPIYDVSLIRDNKIFVSVCTVNVVSFQ